MNEAQILSRLDTTGDCWTWRGAHTGGYPNFADETGRFWRGHRWFYSRYVAPISPTDIICHHCDNPGCVRPSHLYAGTHATNNRDSVVRKRQPGTKLTDDQVCEIRRRYVPYKVTLHQLAAEYGVSHVQVQRVIKRTRAKYR